jgi:hypothetical protein
VSGGTAHVTRTIGMGGNWNGLPRVSRTSGTVVPDASVSLV